MLSRKPLVQLQTIMEVSPFIIVLKDAEGRWATASKKTLEFFGLHEENYRGKTDRELGEIYPHYSQYVSVFEESDCQAWRAGKQIQTREIVTVGEEDLIFDVIKVPLYGPDGNRDSLVVIGWEITEVLKSEQRYKSLFNSYLEGVYSLDKNGDLLDANKETERITGYSKEELYTMDINSIIVPEKVMGVLRSFEDAVNGNPDKHETQIIRKDGQVRDVQLTTMPAELNGNIIGIQGVVHDITEKKRLDELKRKQSAILARIAVGDPYMEILESITETVESVSEGICSIMYYEHEHNWLRYGYGPRLSKDFTEKIDKFPIGLYRGSCGHAAFTKELTIVSDIETDPSWSNWSHEALGYNLRSCWSVPILSINGSLLGTFAVYYKEVREPQDMEVDMLRTFSHLIGLAIERNKHEEKVQFLANHDALTNLPNLRYLRSVFEKASQETQNLAVMFLDLDQFKALNDTFGHEYGDLLLQEAAKRIKETVGETNVVARLGGDEFILLVSNIRNQEMAYAIADQLLKVVEEPVIIRNREFRLTASIGISLYAEHGSTIDALMKNADVAMYNAKNSGGNASKIYDIAMNDKAYEFYMLQAEFRKALEQEQFLLHYQPKVNIQTGVITGVESLARWQHPEKGMISPATFIPLAEQNGFIVELGMWVIRNACLQLKKWKEQDGLNIRIAVNVSVKQLIKQDIASFVKDTLEELALSPEGLEIEITESVLSSHESIIQESVEKLQKIGVKVSIDDFGTGYASLTYLKQFKANTIKIDRSFIRLLPHNKEDAAIVSAVITLAKALNMDVIAEGVETKEQLDFLIRKGCTEVQGYYYSPPLPAEEIHSLLKNGRL